MPHEDITPLMPPPVIACLSAQNCYIASVLPLAPLVPAPFGTVSSGSRLISLLFFCTLKENGWF